MDSKTGGQLQQDNKTTPENKPMTSSEMQRKTAAEIARKKVLMAYDKAAKEAEENPNDNSGQMKNEPINARETTESWKKYHSAWQDYYQKYYSNYYSQAARNYIEKERLKDAREKAEEEEILNSLRTIRPTKTENTEKTAEENAEVIERDLKRRIRKKATDNAKKSRRWRKFIPLLAGMAVVLVILFLQYNRLIFAPIMAYISPGNAPASEIEAIDPTITTTVSADPRLIIPKINVDVPINFGVSVDGVMAAMNNGVAHYRIAGASAYPGEIGNFVITGHSAGDVYSSNQYKYIFSGLERLTEGDLIYVNYNSVRYTYRVTGKEIIEPTNVAALVKTTDKPLITLVTCTPLGTSRYRLLVNGEQISPSYAGAETETSVTTEDSEPENLPSNEPEFFEGIWNWLTGN